MIHKFKEKTTIETEHWVKPSDVYKNWETIYNLLEKEYLEIIDFRPPTSDDQYVIHQNWDGVRAATGWTGAKKEARFICKKVNQIPVWWE